ncbi:LOW QUALITY PROTEIN: hypothetical protein V1478_008757, partial [Vespula squamosa]
FHERSVSSIKRSVHRKKCRRKKSKHRSVRRVWLDGSQLHDQNGRCDACRRDTPRNDVSLTVIYARTQLLLRETPVSLGIASKIPISDRRRDSWTLVLIGIINLLRNSINDFVDGDQFLLSQKCTRDRFAYLLAVTFSIKLILRYQENSKFFCAIEFLFLLNFSKRCPRIGLFNIVNSPPDSARRDTKSFLGIGRNQYTRRSSRSEKYFRLLVRSVRWQAFSASGKRVKARIIAHSVDPS